MTSLVDIATAAGLLYVVFYLIPGTVRLVVLLARGPRIKFRCLTALTNERRDVSVYAVHDASQAARGPTSKALRKLGVSRMEAKRCFRPMLPSYAYMVISPAGVELWRRPDVIASPTLVLPWSQITYVEYISIPVTGSSFAINHYLMLHTGDRVVLPLKISSEQAGFEIIELADRRIGSDADDDSSA